MIRHSSTLVIGPETLYVHWQHFTKAPDSRGACEKVDTREEADGWFVCFSYDENDDRGRYLRFISFLPEEG